MRKEKAHEQIHFQAHNRHEADYFQEGLCSKTPSAATKDNAERLAVFQEAREWIEKRRGPGAELTYGLTSRESCGDGVLINVYY